MNKELKAWQMHMQNYTAAILEIATKPLSQSKYNEYRRACEKYLNDAAQCMDRAIKAKE